MEFFVKGKKRLVVAMGNLFLRRDKFTQCLDQFLVVSFGDFADDRYFSYNFV